MCERVNDPQKCIICLAFSKEQKKLLDKSRFKSAKKTPGKSPMSSPLDDSILDKDPYSLDRSSVQTSQSAEPSVQELLRQVMGSMRGMQDSNIALLNRVELLEKEKAEKKKKPPAKAKKTAKNIPSAALGAPVDTNASSSSMNSGRREVRDRSPSPELMDVSDDNHKSTEDEVEKKESSDKRYGDTPEAVKTYLSLDFEEPPTNKKRSIFGRSADYKESPSFAMPPEPGLQDSWDHFQRRADGRPVKKGVKDKSKGKRAPLTTGQFLPFVRHNMQWYEVYPEDTYYASPRLQENFKNISKSSFNSPTKYDIPAKQFHMWETIMRENLQAFHNISYFQQSSYNIANDIAFEMASVQKSKSQDDLDETCRNVKFLTNLLSSTNVSMVRTLDGVFDTSLTMNLNMLLSRRDNLLKNCHSDVTEADMTDLRVSDFTSSEVFPSEKLKQVETNFLQRRHTSRSSSPKRQKQDSKYQHSTYRGGFQGAFNRDAPKKRPAFKKPEYGSFPSTQANRSTPNNTSRGYQRGRGQRR